MYYFEATKLLLRYGADPRLLCRRGSNRGVPVAKIIEEKFTRAQVDALLSILKHEYEQIEMRDRFMAVLHGLLRQAVSPVKYPIHVPAGDDRWVWRPDLMRGKELPVIC